MTIGDIAELGGWAALGLVAGFLVVLWVEPFSSEGTGLILMFGVIGGVAVGRLVRAVQGTIRGRRKSGGSGR